MKASAERALAIPARLLFPLLEIGRLLYELGARERGRRRFRSCGRNVRFFALDSVISFSQVSAGNNVFIGRWAYFSGEIDIGDNVMFGAMVHITDGYHRIDKVGSTIQEAGPGPKAPVVVEDDVWIGARVTLMRGVRVGEGAVVGAGAIVLDDVPPYSVVVGIPAKVQTLRFSDNTLREHLVTRGRSASCVDYEGVELGIFRYSGTTLLFPSVIPAERFVERGFPVARLQPFPGLKEDLSFAGLDVDSVPATTLPPPRDVSVPGVLVRPPSQTSHYRADESVDTLNQVLGHLAPRTDAQIIFSPREPEQIAMLERHEWKVPPVILDHPLPVVSLLRAVSWVVTGGGTMLREAAWLGVPSISVFQGSMPTLDHWLAIQGAILRVDGVEDLKDIDWGRPAQLASIPRRPEALDRVVELVLAGRRASSVQL